MKKIVFTTCIFTVLFINSACKKNGPDISDYNSETHNAGNSCLECHTELQICGTLYNTAKTSNFSNVKVKLLTSPDKIGTVKTALEVDKSGNFYTINKIDYKGLYPVVEYSNGEESQYMKSSINSGDCNLCHQESDKIWIK